MSELQTQTIEMIKMLPEDDLSIVNALIKRLVLLWDPDFTKTTPTEKKTIDNAIQEIRNGEYYTEEEVWN